MLKEPLANLLRRRHADDINDAAYAALYFLHWQVAIHGRRFASRRFKHDPRPNHIVWMMDVDRTAGDELQARLIRYFERYSFLGVIPNVCTALHAWLHGRWPLTLCEHVPSPEEMLRMQVQGSRAVTILSEYPRLLQPVLKKPSAFAFMVHDLEHAYKFFYDPDLHEGQKGFFSRVLNLIERGLFDDCMRDPVFVEKFNYLISDMNTHVMHSLQFLRAILIECHLRNEGKEARESMSQKAQAEVDAIMRLFNGCWDFVGEMQKQHPSGIASTESSIHYADGMA